MISRRAARGAPAGARRCSEGFLGRNESSSERPPRKGRPSAHPAASRTARSCHQHRDSCAHRRSAPPSGSKRDDRAARWFAAPGSPSPRATSRAPWRRRFAGMWRPPLRPNGVVTTKMPSGVEYATDPLEHRAIRTGTRRRRAVGIFTVRAQPNVFDRRDQEGRRKGSAGGSQSSNRPAKLVRLG